MKKKIYVKPESRRIKMASLHMLAGSEYIYRGTPTDKGDGSEDPDKEEWPKPGGDTGNGGDYWIAE